MLKLLQNIFIFFKFYHLPHEIVTFSINTIQNKFDLIQTRRSDVIIINNARITHGKYYFFQTR